MGASVADYSPLAIRPSLRYSLVAIRDSLP
jgi:hypothetical protein